MDWESEYIRNFVAMVVEQGCTAHKSAGVVLPSAPVEVGAEIVADVDCICAGLPLIEQIFRALDHKVQISLIAQDGQEVRRDEKVVELRGNAAAILRSERTALDLLEHLSGIATTTRRLAGEVRGRRAKICGPREATPGLRWLEEYAVELGGGKVHPASVVLLTSHHVGLVGGVKAALDQAHSLAALQLRPPAMTAYEAVGTSPGMCEARVLSVQIEVQNESELREALDAGAEFVILKNTSLEDARRCVRIVREIRAEVMVQITGEITAANVRAYAETGADYLCCEKLTHSTPRTNFKLLVEQREEK
ncbi:MAG TPA: hypothetical protein VMH20_11370 [Verrucomicrobiae bacterium]|nr:hypothetical protein [Verrucomicrobiae bacterium]